MRRLPVFPTLLTLGNAFCGFLSLCYIADAVTPRGTAEGEGLLVKAAWMIFLAMAFDAFDGRMARVSGKASQFGAELDSLADLISFGIAPAFLVKVLAQVKASTFFSFHPRLAMLLSVLFVLCVALRLARYNVEARADRSHGPRSHFQGLPSPAAAGTLAGVVLLFFELTGTQGFLRVDRETRDIVAQVVVHALPLLLPVMGFLMVSRIPYAHLVNRYASGRRPLTYLAQVVFLSVMAVFQPELTLALAFLGYAGLYPFLHLRAISARHRAAAREQPAATP